MSDDAYSKGLYDHAIKSMQDYLTHIFKTHPAFANENLYIFCYDDPVLHEFYAYFSQDVVDARFNKLIYEEKMKKFRNALINYLPTIKCRLGALFNRTQKTVEEYDYKKREEEACKLRKEEEAQRKREQEREKKKQQGKDTGIVSPYGFLHPDSCFYIGRKSDEICWDALSQPHTTLAIQAGSKMGKSSFMERVRASSKKRINKKTVLISFRQFSETDLTKDEEVFYKHFCQMIGRVLKIDSAKSIDSDWPSWGLAKTNCMDYLADYILPDVKPFILALDDVDRIVTSKSKFQSDFFSMLRLLHEEAKRDDLFKKMTSVLTISDDPSRFILDLNHSPFNVAQIVHSVNFDETEIKLLIDEYIAEFTKPDSIFVTLNPSTIKQLTISLLNVAQGHPFLIQLALFELANHNLTLEQILSEVTTGDGPFYERLASMNKNISE
ncbi:AAA-like domain-containing protein [Anaerolineales bacterium HSG25]|nr:AAA-like domain-containing protein [Anaerolineales bacterium HSG25]